MGAAGQAGGPGEKLSDQGISACMGSKAGLEGLVLGSSAVHLPSADNVFGPSCCYLNSAVALSTISTAKRDSAIIAAACMSSCCWCSVLCARA